MSKQADEELSQKRINRKHEYTGMSHTVEYKTWSRMKMRCYNPNETKYRDYGARGIKVCQKWLNSFKSFYDDMGPRPSSSHSIDRIDVNGNYEPSNCRWATPEVQAANRRLKSKTGYPYVTQDKDRFRATIYKDKVRYYLGKFDTAEAAHIKALEKRKELYGQ